jgi:hypothetical protein
MKITASAAEKMRQQLIGEIEPSANPVEEFNIAVKNENWNEVVNILNKTWFGIPESRDAHNIPSFHVLCDLCSECYCVLGDNDERSK